MVDFHTPSGQSKVISFQVFSIIQKISKNKTLETANFLLLYGQNMKNQGENIFGWLLDESRNPNPRFLSGDFFIASNLLFSPIIDILHILITNILPPNQPYYDSNRCSIRKFCEITGYNVVDTWGSTHTRRSAPTSAPSYPRLNQ